MMLAVIYRTWVLQDKEDEYQKLWHVIANYFVKKRGAIGSCLHKTDEGYWLAYSRWPDKVTRDASWPGENAPSPELPDEIRQAIIDIKACIDQDRKFSEICMDIKSDLLP
jgi:hypothetical protein